MTRLALVLAVAALAAAVPQPQSPQPFSTRIVLVPIDVRVVDRDGKAVTDLKRADFSVTEDGRPQQISQFSTHDAGSSASAFDPRTFLLVLGRGRLQEPAKGIDAAVELVRDHLLPDDRIALAAYDRITDFTTDHAVIVRALERYRQNNESIDGALTRRFLDERSQIKPWMMREIPPPIQADIDAIFDGAGMPASHEPAAAGVRFKNATSAFSLVMLDLMKLSSCIEELRRIEGEKHLVWMTTDAFTGRSDSRYGAARLAADARVVLHVIQTGGVPAGLRVKRTMNPDGSIRGKSGWQLSDFEWPSFEQRWFWQDARSTAETTGGLSSLFGDAREAVARVDRLTRFHYLLGYSPSHDSLDETHRLISVSVNRPGVTVLYRYGYVAHRAPSGIDERSYVTQSRILSGVLSAAIPIRLAVSQKTHDHQRFIEAEVRIDPTPVLLHPDERGRYVATLDVAIFASDKDGRLVGESWDKAAIDLSAAEYARLLKENLALAVHTPVTSWPSDVKAVVYDYESDSIGTATRTLRRP